MKTVSLSIVFISLVTTASADALRDQITAANAGYHKAMIKNDMKAMEAMMKNNITSDFTYEEMGRKLNFDQMITQMKAGMGAMKKITEANSKLITLKETGTKATATTLRSMAGVTMGPDKKQHTMAFSGTTTDTYVKQGGKWKFSKMVWGKQTMSMDGKVMDPSKM